MNGIYIREYDSKKLKELLIPYIRENYNIESYSDEWLIKFTEIIRGNLEVLSDVKFWAPIFFEDIVKYDEDALNLLKNSDIKNIINVLVSELENIDNLDDENYVKIFKKIMKQTKIKGKNLFMPVRAIITGKTTGPDLQQTLILIGKEKILKRIKCYCDNYLS